MYIKIVCLCFILLEFVHALPTQCNLKRVPRSNDNPSEKLKFYLECPKSADPMVSMASEELPVAQESGLSKLLGLSELKKPLIKKPIIPLKGLNLNKLRIPNVKAEMPMLSIDELRSSLSNAANNLLLPKLSNVPDETINLVGQTRELSGNLKNKLDNPVPQGRLSNGLKDLPLKGLSLDKLRIPNVKAEMPMLSIDELRSSLSNAANNLLLPGLSNVPNEAINLVEETRELSDNFNNILDNSVPQGRLSNALNDLIISRRRSQDTLPSPSDIVNNRATDEDKEDITPELTLTEKLQAIVEERRQILQKKIDDVKSRLSKLRTIPDIDDAEEGASNNNIVAQEMPSDNADLKTSLSERAKLLREKLIAPLKRNMEKERSAFPEVILRQSPLNNDISQTEQEPALRLDNLAEKTRTIAGKLKKLIDMDEGDAIKTLNDDIASRIQPEESQKVRVSEKQPALGDKLKNLMNQNPRKAESPLTKRQKDDSIISPTNPEVVSDIVPDKISNVKSKMAEYARFVADKIKNAIQQSASNLNKMRSSGDADSAVDNSNVDEVVEDAPEGEDMEGEGSDAVDQEVPEDDVIDLTKEGGKSADICKCIRVAFPEKFENGHFVMQSQNEDTVSSPSENIEKQDSLIPSFDRILSKSNLGNKLKNIFRSRTGDMATMADEARPTYAIPLEGLDTELSHVERAKMADHGIRSLLEFVKIVDQVDQYITTKARKSISLLATVLAEDENARLL